MPLALQTVNGIHVAALSGPLDNAAGSDLVASIKASVEKGASIILDCTLVSNMDVAGFKHLLALHRWSQGGDGHLILAGMSPEACSLIRDNHCENTFDSRPSVAAAFQALGVSNQAAPPVDDGGFGGSASDPETFAYTPPSSGENPYGQGFADSSATAHDPWTQQPPPMPAPEVSSWASDPVAGNDAWGGIADSSPSLKKQSGSASGEPRSRLPLYIGLGVVAVLLIFGAIWLVDYLKVPTITLSETSVEVQEGQEPGEVTIKTANGTLQEVEEDLPEGLWIEGPEEDEAEPRVYKLAGELETGGKSVEISLRAERNGRLSEPVTLSIKAKPKPLAWLFEPPRLKVGYPIQGYTKIATGAKLVTLKWLTEDPGGFEVKQDQKNAGLWQFSGNPVKPGKFRLEFTATDMSGTVQAKAYDLEVEGEPPPPPLPGLGWPEEFRALTLQEKMAISGFSTVVTNAESVTATWKTENPGGLDVTPAAGSNNWNLVGIPEKSGDFELSVTATPPGGIAETKLFSLTIDPEGKPMTPSSSSSAGESAKEGLDDRMRSFLLERIEKANDHFTPEDKDNLRKMVKLLVDARMIVRVTFQTGKTSLSEKEARRLKQALKDEEIRTLLDDKDCQILVVGYASPSGPVALNVKLSRGRAKSVDELIRDVLGRGADLCGDYGPTDIVSEDQLGNQAVEVFAGKIDVPEILEDVADKFKEEFNRRHGGR